LTTLILAATFLAYAATLGLGFVFDDHVLIVTNDSIRSWRYFPSYFTSHIWAFRYPHLLANYYRPLLLTWLRLNYVLFGLRPWGWHLMSVMAHLGATYFVYLLCRKLLPDAWVAALAALLFGLHPVHVDAVAAVTSMEPLSTFFILAALLTFDRSREDGRRRWGWLAVSLVFTAAALLSKESALVLPLLVAAYSWIRDAHDNESKGGIKPHSRAPAAVRASLPYWLVVLLYLPLRIWALKGFSHVITPLSLARQIYTLPSVLLFYVRLLVWPTGLSCYYDTPYVSSPSFRQFLLPLLGLALIAAGLALWYRRVRRQEAAKSGDGREPRRKAQSIAFACFWMLVTLAPVLNFRFLPANEIAHDRYLYLPSVGFVILAGAALERVWRQAVARPAWAVLAGVALFGGLGYSTARQCLFWSDDLTLNYRAHQIAPHNVAATTSLAAAVAAGGMDRTAMALYRQALAVDPNFWRANVNLAYLYYVHGNMPEAARWFARACESDPTDGDQFLYLGMSLLRLGRLDEAEKAVRTALLVRPQGKDYHLGLAMVLEAAGRRAEVKQELAAELSAHPDNATARDMLKRITTEPPATQPPTAEHIR
jgi:Flp pilus assembly protein TadD